MNKFFLNRNEAVLAVIDIQEKLAAGVAVAEEMLLKS